MIILETKPKILSRSNNDKSSTLVDMKKTNANKVSNNGSFYCVHMLMKYQEGMLSNNYVRPSTRKGYAYHDNDEMSITLEISS